MTHPTSRGKTVQSGGTRPLAFAQRPLPDTPRRRLILLPAVFFTLYLLTTELLYFLGPWAYPKTGAAAMIVFLVACHAAFLLGFLAAARHRPRGYGGRWRLQPLLWASGILTIALLPPTSRQLTASWFPDAWSGIADPGAAYLHSQLARHESLPAVMYVRIVLAPLLAMAVPLTIVYWRRIKRSLRLLGLAAGFADVVLYLSMGTNRAIADKLLMLPWLLLIAHVAGMIRLRRRQGAVAAGVLLVLGWGFAAYFAAGQSSRRGAAAVYGTLTGAAIRIDPAHPVLSIEPPLLRIGVVGLCGYLTQGYYALQLSLREPWIPTLGVGNSMFLFRQAARVTGVAAIAEKPYPVRLRKYGWDAYGSWSTIYPWVASDLSFPGTVVFVFAVGALTALAWRDALLGSNPLAVVAFSQFCLMLCYFPANNQMMQSGEQFVAFWTILLMWLRTRSPAAGLEKVLVDTDRNDRCAGQPPA